jgi:hypothetical protein
MMVNRDFVFNSQLPCHAAALSHPSHSVNYYFLRCDPEGSQAFTTPGIPAIFFLRGRGERPILMHIKRGYRFVGDDAILGLVGANSYAVPQAAGGSVRKKTP